MPKKVFYLARMQNWQYKSQMDLDHGQIVDIPDDSSKVTERDNRLVELGYVTKTVESNFTILECGECGAQFLNESDRSGHGRKRHPHRLQPEAMAPAGPLNPMTGEPNMMLDIEGDKDERRQMRETPLYLEKTKASLKG